MSILTKNGDDSESERSSELTANERLVSANSHRTEMEFAQHAKEAARSSAPAKGSTKARASSGSKRERSFSRSAIDWPWGDSVMIKSLDFSQTTSITFK